MSIKLGLIDHKETAEPSPPQETVPSEAAPAEKLEAALRDLELSETGHAEPPAPPQRTDAPILAAEAIEPVDAEPPKGAGEAIVFWLARYSRHPGEAGRNLRELAAKAPLVAAEVLLPRYEAGECGDATALVAGLLGRNARAFSRLCDPAVPLESAISLAQSLAKQEPRFDAHFAKNLLIDEGIGDDGLERGLSILEQLGSCGRLIPILIQLLRSPNNRVRSRAALTLGRIVPSRGLMSQLMRDADDRVRANFVEGLWNSPHNCVDLFRQALRDSHQRVVGNGLIGLHRTGHHRDVIHHLARMARSPDAPFRATAAWVMGQTGEQRYATVLQHMVHDPDARVRRNALLALRRIKPAEPAAVA